MESLYSSPAYFENHNEGERSCPDFDKLIQRAESENSELLRILEEETQKTLALQKGLELQNKRREEHERSTNQLNEEVKELHKRFLQSKETNESLKKTTALLNDHEEELQNKHGMACSSLQQLKLQNFEIIEKYQNTWKRYHAQYESSEMAGKLSGIKTAALKLQKDVNDTMERITQLKIQVSEVENEKSEMEDLLKLCSPKKAIINLAEMYIEMSNTNNLAKQKLSEQQQKEREIQEMEKEKSSPTSTGNHQEMVQAMECETESMGRRETCDQIANVPDNSVTECGATQPSDTCQANYNELPNTNTSQTRLEGRNEVYQVSPSSTTTSQLHKQMISKGPTSNNSGLFTINTRGLMGYTRLNTPTPASVPSSPLTTHIVATPRRHQLIDSVSVPSPRNLNFAGVFDNTHTGGTVQNGQEQVVLTNMAEQTNESAPNCQIQMIEEQTATSTSTTMKSPGVQSSHSSPKTPTSGQHSDIFNFCDYRERMKQMNKSPGEGFAYQSRPMFESIAEEEGSGDISTADVQTSFFQPFFKPRQQEISDQFSDTPTFFNMSPNKDQEEMVQPSNNFQAHNNTSSTSLCGSLFSMSTRPDKESKESTSGGFTLFGDQLTPKSGNQGNQLSTPKSPDFTFNFGVSPPISEERSTNQGGTFNLF